MTLEVVYVLVIWTNASQMMLQWVWDTSLIHYCNKFTAETVEPYSKRKEKKIEGIKQCNLKLITQGITLWNRILKMECKLYKRDQTTHQKGVIRTSSFTNQRHLCWLQIWLLLYFINKWNISLNQEDFHEHHKILKSLKS